MEKKDGNFKNNFELKVTGKDQVVIDYTPGLMWHQSGSDDPINLERTQKWLQNLNKKGYAGFSDWRLPTLEELESLAESSESADGLFIDPLFSPEQKYLWTGDTMENTKGWVIDFYSGDVNQVGFTNSVYVRPVRSL